jgi:hypothetical protein
MMQSNVQVSKRPMTDAERRSVDSMYGMAQKAARTVGGVAIGFAILSVFMGTLTGSAVDEMISILFTVLLVVFALLGLGLTYATLKLRKTIVDVQRAGYVFTVRGPVTKTGGTKSKRPWSIGPLAIAETPVTVKVLKDGAVTEFVCIPKIKSVISINGAGLEQAAAATITGDLDAMAASSSAPAAPAVENTVEPGTAQKFCPSCGKPLTGTPFCAHCGHKL